MNKPADLRSLESELLKKSRLLEEELRLAAEFQHSMLSKPPPLDYVNIEILYQPYTQVSGDIYDLVVNREHELGVFLGDVTGHGVAAALMTMMVQLAVDTIRRNMSTDEYLRKLNTIIAEQKTGRAVSGLFLRITPAGELTVSHAACLPLILNPADGSDVVIFEKGWLALGVFEEEMVPYEEESWQLKNGDRLIAMTDGVTERRNQDNEVYGQDRLIEFLVKHRQRQPCDIKNELSDELEIYAQGRPAEDDITVLIMEFTGNA